MPRKQKKPRDDPEESERFIALARELEADQSGKVFKRSMADIVRLKRADRKTQSAAKKAFAHLRPKDER